MTGIKKHLKRELKRFKKDNYKYGSDEIILIYNKLETLNRTQ